MHDRSRALGPTPAGASASRTGAAGAVTGVGPRPTRSGGCNSTAADRTVGVAPPAPGSGRCAAAAPAACPARASPPPPPGACPGPSPHRDDGSGSDPGRRPGHGPPATGRPATAPGAVNVPDRPARVMRPAGGLFAPGVHPGPDEVGHPALRAAACVPMSPWGGLAAAKRYRRGEEGPSPPGWAPAWPSRRRARPGRAPRPSRRRPRPRCHASLARPAPRPLPRSTAPRRTGRSGCCHGTTTAPRIFDARTIRT